MNRQYIGARYVPKFYTNSLGGNDWQQGVAYEALTVVTYNGNSYTSKVPVPASVGNPSANPEYWVATGIYSAQVEVLRQQVEGLDVEVDDHETRIDNLEHDYYTFSSRKVLFIGDSYAQGWSPDGQWTGWPERVAAQLGITDYTVRANGGIGFYHANAGVTFGNIANDVTDKDTYTDIVVCGGRNDYDATYDQLIAAVRSAITNYKSLFPYANIHVGMIGYSNENVVDIYKIYTSYLWGTEEAGEHYLYGVETALYNHSQLSSDLIHPNANGLGSIAYAVGTALKNVMYTRSVQMPAPTFDTNVIGSTGAMDAKMLGNHIYLTWPDIASKGNWAGANLSTGTINVHIADQDVGFRFHAGKTRIPCAFVAGYTSGGDTLTYVNCAGYLYFSQVGIYLEGKIISADGSGWASGTLKYFYIIKGAGNTCIWD